MHLDKDILVKNNKIYSPDTCIFVPMRINKLFVKGNPDRRTHIINVYDVGYGKYQARCKKGTQRYENLGSFNTIEEAFNVYKKEKEKYIQSIADEYKAKIPRKLYDAMYKYEVEITD